MTIHTEHPFADHDPQRDAVRQLRGRLGGVVSLWTAGVIEGGAGLTISSLMVVQGEPGRIVALFDPLSDLLTDFRDTTRAVVHLLSWEHRELAEIFAGHSPAPGGPFKSADFVNSAYGPRLRGAITAAGVRWESERDLGWSTEVTCIIETTEIVDDVDPLVHRRGRYRRAREG